MKITKDTLLPFLIYNNPVQYSNRITLYPVTMKDVILFQMLSRSIVVRKNSIFHDKQIIKMSYLEFLLYCFDHREIELQSGIADLSQYFIYAVQLLQLCCKDCELKIEQQTGTIMINEEIITSEIFDDMRRIIIIQNDIDFDIDDFLHYDTEQRLLKAQQENSKTKENANIEDYIDSLSIAMNITEEQVMNMTIRKFWRYIKRYQLHEGYTIAKTGECSGMVSFREPIRHWMVSLDEDEPFREVKTDENTLKNKINGANN